MRKLIVALALLVVLLMSAPVGAQGDMHFSLVSVDVWPEYDQPAVLVVYHITLTPDTALPATLTVKIPVDAQLNAVAVVNPVNGLINASYGSAVQGKWTVLTITSDSLQVQVEYYDALVKANTERHIVFEWVGDFSVDSLVVNFLQPTDVQNVAIVPMAIMTGLGQDGLTNYRVQTANLAAGQSFTVTIDYQRQTNDLSIANLPVLAASTPGPETPGRVSMTGILPWILAGIGVLLIVSGIAGVVVWQRGGRTSTVRRRPVRRRTEAQAEVLYCHECGKRAQSGDAFCRICGARLKRGSTD